MKEITLIGAGSDLGVNIDGARLAPKILINKIKSNYKIINLSQDENIIKSQNQQDMKKNLSEVNKFNQKLYNTILNETNFCLTIGGDHSISIGSALASLKKHQNLGIIWIDSHLDYNTFKTTITGNLHGLPLAALNGLNQELSHFHDGIYFNPKNTVVVGYRAFEENAYLEIENIKTMGVTVFTTKDIKEMGVDKVMELAFSLASKNTDGIHVSFDLDVIDPIIAKGVTIKEKNGLNLLEVNLITKFLNNLDNIKSFDLVEYNPINDQNNETLNIAINIIKDIFKKKQK